jgi:hypothetical protein
MTKAAAVTAPNNLLICFFSPLEILETSHLAESL